MKKKVDIYPTIRPVMTVVPPIMAPVVKVEMYTGDIERCLYERAIVDEVLEDDTRVRLNLSNFDKDNSKKAPEEEEDEPSHTVQQSTGVTTPQPAPQKQEAKQPEVSNTGATQTQDPKKNTTAAQTTKPEQTANTVDNKDKEKK